MRLLSILFLLGLSNFVYCQNNLVPNYSFENMSSTEYCGTNAQLSELLTPNRTEKYWDNMDNWDVARWYFWCFSGKIASPDYKCDSEYLAGYDLTINARTGTKYIFTATSDRGGYHEFVINKLNSKLDPNCTYYYEFYYAAASGKKKSNIGIKFYTEHPYQCNNSKLNGEDATKCDIGGGEGRIPSDKEMQWIRAYGYFTPTKEFSHLAIGVWGEGDDANIGCYFDDVRIVPMCHNSCPEEWLIDNTTFSNDEIFQASDQITIGNGSNPEVIDGNVIIENNSTVTLIALDVVELSPGLIVEDGSELEVSIGQCDISPCSRPKFNSEKEIEVCSGNSHTLNLTTEEKETWDVSWSPQIHLDDPKSLNPLFTPPSGDGEIEYTLTIKTLCGNSFSKKVNIIYKESPNLNPYHSIQFTPSEFGFTGTFTGQVATGMKEVEYEVVGDNFSRTHKSENIGCCNIDFETDAIPNFETCNDYKILFRTKNFCTDNFHETSYDLRPPKSNVLLKKFTQIVTLNKDGIDESIAITTSAASRFKITVRNIWGTRKACKEGGKFNEGDIFQENQVVWTPKDNISSGTYYWVLELFNDCGATTHNYNGFVTIFNERRIRETPSDINESITEVEKAEIMKLYGPQNATFIGEDNLNLETVNSSSEPELETNYVQVSDDRILVYPNPAKDYINVELSTKSNGKANYELFNYLGKSVYKSICSDQIHTISLLKLKKGVYFLSVKTSSSSFNQKIVIK